MGTKLEKNIIKISLVNLYKRIGNDTHMANIIMILCYVHSTLIYEVEAWKLSEPMEISLQALGNFLGVLSYKQRSAQELECEPEIMCAIKRGILE